MSHPFSTPYPHPSPVPAPQLPWPSPVPVPVPADRPTLPADRPTLPAPPQPPVQPPASLAIPRTRFITSHPFALAREQEELDEHACALCDRITVSAASPALCQCAAEHVFCRACIAAHLASSSTCPVEDTPLTLSSLKLSQRVARGADRLIVRCVHARDTASPIPARRGCMWKAPVSALYAHERDACHFRPVECPACGVGMTTKALGCHRQTCGVKEVCGACGKEAVASDGSDDHRASCSAARIPCPNNCFVPQAPAVQLSAADQLASFPRREIAAHLEVCPLVPSACPFPGCEVPVMRGNRADHEMSSVREHLRLLLQLKTGLPGTPEDAANGLSPTGSISKTLSNTITSSSLISVQSNLQRLEAEVGELRRALGDLTKR